MYSNKKRELKNHRHDTKNKFCTRLFSHEYLFDLLLVNQSTTVYCYARNRGEKNKTTNKSNTAKRRIVGVRLCAPLTGLVINLASRWYWTLHDCVPATSCHESITVWPLALSAVRVHKHQRDVLLPKVGQVLARSTRWHCIRTGTFPFAFFDGLLFIDGRINRQCNEGMCVCSPTQTCICSND